MKKGDRGGARQTLAQAFVLASASQEKQTSPPALEALILIAEARAELGDVADALKTADAVGFHQVYCCSPELFDAPFQLMLHKHSALMFIARAQSRSGDTAGALKTLEAFRSQDDEKHFTDRMKAYCYHEIARAKARAGDLDRTLAWAKERQSALEREWALQGIVAELVRQKMQKEAP